MSPPDGAGADHIRRLVNKSKDVNWPDPEPLFEPTEAERPYPIEALPPIIAKAIQEYRAYGQQPLPLIACSALAGVSLAAQGLADVARDQRLVGPISLHFSVVAMSGERKTSADRVFNKPLRDWVAERCEALQPDADRARAELAAWEAERDGLLAKIKSDSGKRAAGSEVDIAALKSCLVELEAGRPDQLIMPSLFYEDTNAQRLAVDLAVGWPSASLWSDEGGLVVGSHGMSDDNLMGFLGLLNRLWDGQPFERRRMTAPSAIVKGRRLTVSLMMQDVVFARLASAADGASRGMGYIARLLMARPASTIGARPYRASPDGMPALDELHRRLRELLDLPLSTEGAGLVLLPPVLGLSPPAFTVWRSLHDEVEMELSRAGEFGSIPDIGAKIAENAARIAAQFHLVAQGPSGSIDAATMEGAAAVAIWHLNEARRIVGTNGKPQDAADAELLSVWLVRQPEGRIDPRDILHRGPNSLRNKARRDAALKVLSEKRWVYEVKEGGGTQIMLNPKVGARDGSC
jgi:hypothetical protein